VSSRKYKGAKLESERKFSCNDFDAAMTKVESMIESLRGDYKVAGEKEKDGPTDTLPVLGKRQSSRTTELMPSQSENKRIKIDEKLSVTKSDQKKASVKPS